jgi:regulator of replication initiation timing
MGKKMSEMTIEELREYVLNKIESNKKFQSENAELRARIAQLEEKIAGMVEQVNGGENIEIMPDPRVIWADGAVADMVAEIHKINRTDDNSLIGLNSAEVDLTNQIMAIKNECPKPGLVKGVANKFIVEPLEAARARVREDIERITLKVING